MALNIGQAILQLVDPDDADPAAAPPNPVLVHGAIQGVVAEAMQDRWQHRGFRLMEHARAHRKIAYLERTKLTALPAHTLQQIEEHNKRFSKPNQLLPPIEEDKVLYGTEAAKNIWISFQKAKEPVAEDLMNLGPFVQLLELDFQKQVMDAIAKQTGTGPSMKRFGVEAIAGPHC